MQYFVIAPDGQKYGPADVMTLNQWVQQNRVTPTTMLEDAATGAQIPASQVPGLVFTAPPSNQNPYNAAPGYQQYPRDGFSGDNGDGDVKKAWIFGTVGLLQCCPVVFSALGIYYASQGIRKGHPGAKNAQIYCICTLILGLVVGVIFQTRLSGSYR